MQTMDKKYDDQGSIVVTYFQFDSNIRVFYVFLGFLKNTWKYLIQRPIFKPLYFYNAFLKILENTSFWAPSKNTRISYVTTMRWSQLILKIILVLVPRRFDVWVTCVLCISITVASSILVLKMKFPRSKNLTTSQWKDMLFSNLWIRLLFTNFAIPFHFMLTLVKVD